MADALKQLVATGPQAAHGCAQCHFGIAASMPLTRVVPLYLERIVQMDDGLLEFCTCQAGTLYRVSLLNMRQKLVEEARHQPPMHSFAERGTHPELEAARRAVFAAQPAPTIHGEPVESQ